MKLMWSLLSQEKNLRKLKDLLPLVTQEEDVEEEVAEEDEEEEEEVVGVVVEEAEEVGAEEEAEAEVAEEVVEAEAGVHEVDITQEVTDADSPTRDPLRTDKETLPQPHSLWQISPSALMTRA